MPNKRRNTICEDTKLDWLAFAAIWTILALVAVVAFAVFFAGMSLNEVILTYTTDVEDYGEYTGTNHDTFADEYINSFFPLKLEPYFSEVYYSYSAVNTGECAFEAYLEIIIEDPVTFDEYVSSLASESEWDVFSVDSRYKERSIENELRLWSEIYPESEDTAPVYITEASIKKILYSQDEQRIIFVALCVCDNSAVPADVFNAFFNRFGLDAAEYLHIREE